MSGTRINVSLDRHDIGLSGAVPGEDSWSEPAMDRAILEFVALFSSIVFKYGGRIVHGSHPTFTPVILRQARLHAGGERPRKPVTLVMSELWAKNLSTEFHECGPDNVETRNQSLTEMRTLLIASQNVMVAVGGKMHSNDGIVPGLGEEMDLAARKRIPRFLIAGMGGFAAEYASQLTPNELQNGLSEEENALLFSTTDVSASVNLLFERLCNLP
jgi:hypothetical protein